MLGHSNEIVIDGEHRISHVHMKPYPQKDLLKSRDMSYLSRCFIEKKEYIETKDTLEKSIQFIRDYYKIDRLDTIVDFCSGHTFNASFALSRNYSKYVLCIDSRFPNSSNRLQTYYQKYMPRMILKQENIFTNNYNIPKLSLVLSIHPCRDLSYRVSEIAIQNRVPIVIVPCCTGGNNRRSWIDDFPDINRYDRHSMKIAQFLEEYGYNIRIRSINKNYTPRNNIIIGLPRIT